ncbi:MAG: putative 6.7 kDa protein [unidentified tobacco necrosis virus]|nr:MAG: putative 6.7 kDa protein [unidentified tobacco necrosis virus]
MPKVESHHWRRRRILGNRLDGRGVVPPTTHHFGYQWYTTMAGSAKVLCTKNPWKRGGGG